MQEWILASSSKRRIQLLEEIGFHFRCISPTVEEVKQPGNHSTVWVAITNAQRKAQTVSEEHPDAYVIGADTIVIMNEEVFNKPKDIVEAKTMLQKLSGKTHLVTTAVSIFCKNNHIAYNFSDTTQVHFSELNTHFIENYLNFVQPLDKAGGYAIQHPLSKSFIRIEGSYANVMGFPIECFQNILAKHFKKCIG